MVAGRQLSDVCLHDVAPDPPGRAAQPGSFVPTCISVRPMAADRRSGTTMLDHLTPLLSSPWLYVSVFAAVVIDGFIPVVPVEVVVIGLGAVSATGSPKLVALAAAVVTGGM